jgi:uncharacterized protein YbaP (TraB family)
MTARALRAFAPWLLVWLFAAVQAAHAAPINSQGVLWKVARAGVADSYLFGTMHTPDARVLALPENARAALEDSQVVALELLIADARSAAAAGAELAGAMMLTDGRTLDNILGAETFDTLAATLAKMGLPRFAAQRLRPWAAYLMLNFPQASLEPGAAPEPVLDQTIERLARERGARLVALETIDEQVEVFAGMAEADMVRLLERMIAVGAREGELHAYLDDYFKAVTELYLAGDIGGILEAWRTQLPGDDEALVARLIERLITRRNRTMVERMTALLDEGRAFVAVGAAHLPGEGGVINLLSEAGYTVSPVR